MPLIGAWVTRSSRPKLIDARPDQVPTTFRYGNADYQSSRTTRRQLDGLSRFSLLINNVYSVRQRS